MLLRPRRRGVQITKKSKRMNNSKRRAEFLYWGQGIKRGWGGQQDPRPGYLSVLLGQWWVHRHILLIYYLHFDVYAYFITQERSKWGRQEANAMGQRAARGRGEGQGMGCRLVLNQEGAPQPADGDPPPICPIFPRGPSCRPSLRLTPYQNSISGCRVCPPA